MRPSLFSLLPLLATATVAAVGDAAPRRSRTPAGPALTVVPSGAEQALKLDGAMLNRPFGGALVDRMTVAGRYPLSGGRTIWLVRGEGGAECASQYVVVERVTGLQPVVSPVFGCNAQVTARAAGDGMQLTAFAAGQPMAPLVWRQGALQSSAPAQAEVAQACTVAAGDPAAIDASLDAALPESLRRGRDLRRTDIGDAEMEARLLDLACLATWPGADVRVAQAAMPLFASKAHGSAAFAALDRVARRTDSPTAVRAAFRTFSARMRYQVGQHEPVI